MKKTIILQILFIKKKKKKIQENIIPVLCHFKDVRIVYFDLATNYSKYIRKKVLCRDFVGNIEVIFVHLAQLPTLIMKKIRGYNSLLGFAGNIDGFHPNENSNINTAMTT